MNRFARQRFFTIFFIAVIGILCFGVWGCAAPQLATMPEPEFSLVEGDVGALGQAVAEEAIARNPDDADEILSLAKSLRSVADGTLLPGVVDAWAKSPAMGLLAGRLLARLNYYVGDKTVLDDRTRRLIVAGAVGLEAGAAKRYVGPSSN